MDSVQIPVGDLVFDAVATGPADGPLVVLLHGFPQTSWSWRGVWPALADAGFRVVAPDQRGHSPGARPPDVSAYRMTHLVADVVGMLDHLGVEEADVVGHDWGAAVAWQLAARHPERLRTLTAVSVPHPLAFVEALRTDPDQRARSQYMRDWQAVGTTEDAMLAGGLERVFDGIPGVAMERYLSALRQPGALTAALNWYRAQSRADLDGVGQIAVPTLHVWSDNDPALGEVATRASAEYVDAPYRLEVLQGVSHWIPEEAAERLAALVLEHLQRAIRTAQS
jgi:pimeloyl-ACP methyl ester carboxylesterase